MSTVLNLWRRGPLNRNPYRHTAFRLARVPREIADRAMVVELVAQVRQVSEMDPESHRVDGRPVSASEVNQAELTLLDPQKRVLEELLEHGFPSVARDRLAALANEAASRLSPSDNSPRPWIRTEAMSAWLADAFAEDVSRDPGVSSRVGAAEVDLIPPWGR